MNKPDPASRILSSTGVLLWCLFQLTKNTIPWPAFIYNNINVVAAVLITVGYILMLCGYFTAHQAKKGMQIVLFTLLYIAIMFLLYFVTL